MNLPRDLLLTLAWLCLSASTTHAKIWCYCDTELCTSGNRSEPCPDQLPASMHGTLLGVFFERNEQGLTLKSFIGTMIEKGFDETKIAELMRGILPEDMAWVIKQLDANQLNLRQFLEASDKATVEAVLRGVMDKVRDVFKDRYNPVMSDKQFATEKRLAETALKGLDLPNGVADEVLKLATKLNIRDFNKNSTLMELQDYISTVQKMLVNELKSVMGANDKRIAAYNKKPVKMPDEEFLKIKRKIESTLLSEEMSKQVAAEFIKAMTKNTVKFFLPRPPEIEDFLTFLKTHPDSDNSQYIIQFVEKLPISQEIDNRADKTKSNLRQELKRGGVSERDIKELFERFGNASLKNFTSGKEAMLNKFEDRFNGSLEKDFMKQFMDSLPETVKSEETDLEDIKAAFHESWSTSQSRQKRSLFEDDDDPKQFCLKAIIPRGKTIRFCGHLAAQVTGFDFREGCHYEQMLGVVRAKICRCGTHLCNQGVLATGGLVLCFVAVILVLIKTTAV